ncbi:MAG: FAD-binding oxidoreductase [Synechococcales cyanobacterium M58_A2018_015]|nr:FAD-binding oxidoreductase [Synechococcales cyanobacterium M58_A2018_015]
MTQSYDWIVVGGGLAGCALGYELARAGFTVLLIDPDRHSATRYSYGGIAYWSGTTPLTQQLCQEGIALHRQLPQELGAETHFCDINLLLTIDPDRNPTEVAAAYASCALLPTLLSPQDAHQLEPLLNPAVIAGALQLPHGQVCPEALMAAYRQALQQLGGEILQDTVTGMQPTGSAQAVKTALATYSGANVAICAGAWSRALLKAAGYAVRLYFTQAELVETPPVEVRLHSLIMPAELKRFGMEATAGQADTEPLWDEPGHEILPPILDAGVVQLQDGRLRMGQVSRTLTDPLAVVDAEASEAAIRAAVGRLLPALEHLPGQWCCCLVSFSGDRLPLVGALPAWEGVHLFAGFSNPFALLPPVARRFAQAAATGQADELLAQLAPSRFPPSASQ